MGAQENKQEEQENEEKPQEDEYEPTRQQEIVQGLLGDLEPLQQLEQRGHRIPLAILRAQVTPFQSMTFAEQY